MMRRWLLVLALLPFYALYAQEEGGEKPEEGVFSLALFLEAAEYAADGCWQPDWPLDFPPDAFSPVRDDWLSITLGYGENRYCLRRDREGHVLEFPFLLDGVLVQAVLGYSADGGTQGALLKSAHLTAAEIPDEGIPDELLSLEVLEYRGDYPYLLRVFRNELYFFVLLERRTNCLFEAWFDEEGSLLGGYEHRLMPVSVGLFGFSPKMKIEISQGFPGEAGNSVRYSFDSRSLKTSVKGREGDFFIHYYKENLPRYWERRPASFIENEAVDGNGFSADDGTVQAGEKPGRYSFQWDEGGFLVRFSGSLEEGGALVDSRYEYKLDERGNWNERREIRMSNRFGYLAAGSGMTISRLLEYEGDSADVLPAGEASIEVPGGISGLTNE